MKKFGVVIIERPTGEIRILDTWDSLDEAEDQRKFLEAFMPGVIIQVHDWSEIDYKEGLNSHG